MSDDMHSFVALHLPDVAALSFAGEKPQSSPPTEPNPF